MSRSRITLAALLCAVGLAVAGPATPAMAKVDGGKAQTGQPLDCFGDFGDPTIPNMTTPDVAVNYAGTAGCVGVRQTDGRLRLAWVVLAPGWSYVVKSDGTGTSSRVQLQFRNAGTGASLDFRYELGKTVIG